MVNIEELRMLLDNNIGTKIVLDDEHCIVKKTMNVDDEELDHYVKNLSLAKEKGVNVVRIAGYSVIDKKKSMGYYVLDRCIGTTYNNESIIKINRFDDLADKIAEYFRYNKMYLKELEKRSNASQEQFTKLVSDLIQLHLLGINADTTVYNKENGFTIRDTIYPIKSNTYHTIVMQVLDAIFGKGRPMFYMRDTYFECLTKVYVDEYVSLYEKIIPKIMIALHKNGVHTDYINKAIVKYNRLINYNGYIALTRDDIYKLLNNNLKVRTKK